MNCAEKWNELLGWLDSSWFLPEKVEWHDFDAAERELFEALDEAWLAAEPGSGKIAALEAMGERFGRERVVALIARICRKETSEYWGQLARDEGGTLDDLVRLLWSPLPDMGFEFTSKPLPGGGLEFCVTRCPQAELGRALGAPDWLYAMTCSTDPHAAAAFGLGFERTKTLMQGHDCCDHTYFVEPPVKPPAS